MKVLFVGNSHTYYNDMPRIFASLARDNGHDVQVESVTKGGWILPDRADTLSYAVSRSACRYFHAGIAAGNGCVFSRSDQSIR